MTYSLQKPGTFAQISDARPVVVREHLVPKNSVRNLRRMHQVHLKEFCLKVTLFRLVLFKRVEQERCGRLDHVLGHENVDDLRVTYQSHARSEIFGHNCVLAQHQREDRSRR